MWSLPFVVVAALIATGRASSTTVGLFGLVTSLIVAMVAPPHPFGARDALGAIAHGGWLALLVGAVILGGLFFREVISEHGAADDPAPVAPERRRKQLYTTRFLIGPFAEGATGFGVGQVTIAPMLNGIGLAPLHAILFGLFSQMMVSWGAMANGTIVGAQLSGIAPTDLGVHSALLTAPLLIAWLCLFWRIAALAKVPGTALDFVGEALCTAAAAGLLVAANAVFGPEVAALAALGPLIVARFLMNGRPDREQWRSALRVGLPYVALIAVLMATRAITPVNEWLRLALAVKPFADGPAWFPLPMALVEAAGGGSFLRFPMRLFWGTLLCLGALAAWGGTVLEARLGRGVRVLVLVALIEPFAHVRAPFRQLAQPSTTPSVYRQVDGPVLDLFPDGTTQPHELEQWFTRFACSYQRHHDNPIAEHCIAKFLRVVSITSFRPGRGESRNRRPPSSASGGVRRSTQPFSATSPATDHQSSVVNSAKQAHIPSLMS